MEILSTVHDLDHMTDKVENAAFSCNPQSSLLEIASATSANQRIVFTIVWILKSHNQKD